MFYTYVGIDVSKDKLDLAIPTLEGKYQSFQLVNTEEGFAGPFTQRCLLGDGSYRGLPLSPGLLSGRTRSGRFGSQPFISEALCPPSTAQDQQSRCSPAGYLWSSAQSAPLATTSPAPHRVEASLWCAGTVYQTANGAAQSETGLAIDAPLLKKSAVGYR